MLSLGEETARTSGLQMARLRLLALLAAALATGAAVAVAGVIGFVGLAAPHLVRTLVRGDPGRVLLPSALAALIGVVEPVLGPVWVWLVHGELPGVRTLVGGLVVFLALLAHLGWQFRLQSNAPDVR